MSYTLIIVLVIISILAIIYVWYVSKDLHKSDEKLFLHTDENKLLSQYYIDNVKQSLDFVITSEEIATKFIKRIYNITVDPKNIIIGSNLDTQYYQITKRKLNNAYSKNEDSFIRLRNLIGIDGEIAIIYDNNIKNRLYENNKYDLRNLNDIMESNLDHKIYEYLQKGLKTRWTQLMTLNNPNILNYGDSYLYLKIEQDNTEYGTRIDLPENVVALNTSKGARINLLCDDREFELLKPRLTKDISLKTTF